MRFAIFCAYSQGHWSCEKLTLQGISDKIFKIAKAMSIIRRYSFLDIKGDFIMEKKDVFKYAALFHEGTGKYCTDGSLDNLVMGPQTAKRFAEMMTVQ